LTSPSGVSTDIEQTALAIGAFSTTLTTLSLSLMGWRNLSANNVFIGNFFFVAGIGMVVSAQWEMALGNSYAYTVLSAFGLFYGGFGAIITPFFGVRASYGDDVASYNNALGFFVLSKSMDILPVLIQTDTSYSVGRMEFVLFDRFTATQYCVYRDILHSSDGIHLDRCLLFRSC
jgi:succinate-acetate transporter protein